MEHPAAPLLAERLGRLRHTNANGELVPICLPGFVGTAGMADEEKASAGALALAISEAIIETLETDCGHRVTPEAEIKGLRKQAQKSEPVEDVTLTCNRCQQPVIKANVRGKINVNTLLIGLQAHMETCV